MRYMLVGNFGVGNAGDEILREYFLERFSEVEWVVLSANPIRGECSRIPSGVRSLFCSRWIRTLRALRTAEGLVFGGGSLFTDTESVRACWVWFCHALAAWLFKKPIFLAFQGIGPFRTWRGQWLATWALRRAAFISVRDELSQQRVMNLLEGGKAGRRESGMLKRKKGLAPSEPTTGGSGRVEGACPEQGAKRRVEGWKKNTDVVQTFDPSILLMDKQNMNSRTKNVINFIPRFSTVKKERELVLRALESIRQSGRDLRIISLQPEDEWEKSICTQSIHSLRELGHMLGGECVITQRYHGAIAAIAAGIPFVAVRQKDGDKLDALARRVGATSVSIAGLHVDYVIDIPVNTVRDDLFRNAKRGESALKESMIRIAKT